MPLTVPRIAPVLRRPYAETELEAMTPDDWAAIKPVWVPTLELVPTQECLVIDRLAHLLAGGRAEGGDPYGHAVWHDGRLYSHDGHHRWGIRWLSDRPQTRVRVKRIDARAWGTGGSEASGPRKSETPPTSAN